MELIKQEERKAKKTHYCNFCNEEIKPGEKYNYSFLKDGGETYEWKSHKSCQFIVDCIWDYVDPCDGFTEDDFNYTCQEICNRFICPNCTDNTDCIDCDYDKLYCVDKLVDYFKEHEIVRVNASTFEFRKRTEPIEDISNV